jgi:hypothetical protein
MILNLFLHMVLRSPSMIDLIQTPPTCLLSCLPPSLKVGVSAETGVDCFLHYPAFRGMVVLPPHSSPSSLYST